MEGLPLHFPPPPGSADGPAPLHGNESPHGPLPSVVEAVARAAAGANRYPDDEARKLRGRLAERYGLSPERVVVGCGSLDLCRRAVFAAVGAGDEVVHAAPSFAEYPLLARQAGGTPVAVPLRENAHDLPAMAASVGPRTRVVFVCNPNNPTGTIVGRRALAEFLAAVPRDLLVVLDEAYAEFAGGEFEGGTSLLDRHENLLVLRTFSKAYGLGGMRIGYGLTSPGLAEALTKARLTFAVNAPAQAAALASLDAPGELARRVLLNASERERVREALADLGFDVPPSHANFLWLPLPAEARAFADACEAAGVLVQPVGADAVRATVGSPQENDRFLGAARSYNHLRIATHQIRMTKW